MPPRKNGFGGIIMLACDLILAVRASSCISGEQVKRLEREIFSDRAISAEQLDLLFLLDHYAERVDASWTPLLARAVVSGIVLGEAPMGALSEDKADWLLEQIGRHRISSMRGLELLARVMARSTSTPDWLETLVLELATGRRTDARGLQETLAEHFSDAPMAPPVVEAPAAEIIPMPAREAPVQLQEAA